MKLPRNVSGAQLIKALTRLGYEATRQAGSHVQWECQFQKPHRLTVPMHDSLRIGTLASILDEVAKHHSLSKEEVILRLFGSD
ncbi:MAG: type II toxin-antitoxin system HicA family toxin [Nitrosomonas sp. PRO4]|nr:type II toxin-antitoxin system HicA family toxin [Nitrosomonas sp. PRO4]